MIDYTKLTEKVLNELAFFMDFEKREKVHLELAPCSPEDFLRRYLELDGDFIELIKSDYNFLIK